MKAGGLNKPGTGTCTIFTKRYWTPKEPVTDQLHLDGLRTGSTTCTCRVYDVVALGLWAL